jgi:hypothetical protein
MEKNHYEQDDIEKSYILREYFKGFKLENSEVNKIRDKINRTDRNLILDTIVKQNNDIYNLVAQNYANTIDIVNFSFFKISTILVSKN